jgi:isoleucyl-tRNA synthetase
MLYPEYKSLNLPEIAAKVAEKWNKENTFKQSIENRPSDNPFVFYEGPPSANGMPGIHHVMARTIKDIFCRYKTLKGFRVERKAGWDTHGLPIELGVEKALGITKEDIGKSITVEEYNAACRKEVMKYTDIWDDLTKKMGYWVDLEHPYITYENNYIESVWWILQQLYTKNMLYKGFTIQPYSPAAGTGLSSHELNQPGTYKMVKDLTAVAMFRLKADALNVAFENTPYFLAWTTTPWTLPSNTALAVGKDIEYVAVKTFSPYTGKLVTVILAKDLMGKYFPEKNVGLLFEDYKEGDKNIPFALVNSFKGKDLEGIRYEQLLPYAQPESGDMFKVIIGDFVTTEDGTGIVHIAPSFGADDFRVAKANGIGALTLVDKRGKFVSEVSDFPNEYVKEDYLTAEEKTAEIKRLQNLPDDSDFNRLVNQIVTRTNEYLSVDERIAIKLQLDGKLFKKEKYEHTYPHCWRTDKPVLYYPLDSWFVRTTAAKDKLIELNKTINWKPESTGTGRFGNWLENLVDWNLSRSRYWGIPLPIWREDKVAGFKMTNGEPRFNPDEICVSSISGLTNSIGKEGELYKGYYFDSKKYEVYIKKLENRRSIEANELFEIYRKKNIDRFFAEGEIENLMKGKEFFIKNAPYEVLIKFIQDLSDNQNLIKDLHKPLIDNVVFINLHQGNFPEEIELRRILYRESDLIDVWFDSGSMPYAQWHYPFENKELIDQGRAFPADFIAEGVDQTRGWFFTLHAIAVMVFGKVAFKNVVSNGLVLDKNGNKMSKRLGNAVDPFTTLAKYGPDATRWYMISNAAPWENLKFDLEGIGEVQRKLFGTLYNTYSFFAIYANIDQFVMDPSKSIPVSERQVLDRWIISKLHSLVNEVDAYYADYEPTKATRAIEEFVDRHLSNWYVRLSRRVFWKGEMNRDKQAAYETLYECLLTVGQLMSPVAPFFADWMYNNLSQSAREKAKAENSALQYNSVHLSYWTPVNAGVIDADLEERMELAQQVTSMILSLRKKQNIRVRQPLQRIMIPVLDQHFQDQLELVKELILAEVNIKELEYLKDAGIIKKRIKPDFKKLGPKYGQHMKAIANEITAFNQQQIAELEQNGTMVLNLPSGPIAIEVSDVEISSDDIPGWLVASEGKVTVALDITISETLRNEGIARELINRIQNLRKDSGLEVTDRIQVNMMHHDAVTPAVQNNLRYICNEILADSFDVLPNLSEAGAVQVEIDEEIKTLVSLKKSSLN